MGAFVLGAKARTPRLTPGAVLGLTPARTTPKRVPAGKCTRRHLDDVTLDQLVTWLRLQGVVVKATLSDPMAGTEIVVARSDR